MTYRGPYVETLSPEQRDFLLHTLYPRLRVGAFFSGIGGLELGLERAGMTIAWQVEIDPFCRKVLKKHWPGVPKHGDIRTLTATRLEPVDLVCGGFPCQSVSLAGRRRAQDDARWLWPEFSRLVGELRPRYVLVENVPGLLSAGQGAAFAEVLSDLARHGYDAEWASIPAAAVGAPHLRYRIFIVAYSNRKGLEGIHQEIGRIYLQSTPPVRLQWQAEPRLDRVALGIPSRVDRLKALGNAVVPQVAQWIGERIIAFDLATRGTASQPAQQENRGLRRTVPDRWDAARDRRPRA